MSLNQCLLCENLKALYVILFFCTIITIITIILFTIIMIISALFFSFILSPCWSHTDTGQEL